MRDKKVFLILEEIHRAVSRQKMKRYDLSEPLVVRAFRTCRKANMVMVAVDQIPSELPLTLLGNTVTKIVLPLKSSTDIGMISRSMGLDRDEEDALAEMEARRAVVQTRDNPKPFLVKMVFMPPKVLPTKKELEERETQSLLRLDHEMPEGDSAGLVLGRKKKEEPKEKSCRIGGDLRQVLAAIARQPEFTEERCGKLEMDRAREYRARKELLKLGLIKASGKVGGKNEIYAPTAKGAEWAREMGLPVAKYKSGPLHEIMLRKTRDAIGKALSTRITFISAGEGLKISRVQPDLLAMVKSVDGDSSRRVVIQISCTSTHEYETRAALELCEIQEIDMTVVVAKDKRTAKEIENKIEELCARGQGLRDKARSDLEIGQEKEKGRGKGGPDVGLTGSRGGEAGKPGTGMVCPKVIDFTSVVNPGYDWGWIG